MKNFLEVQILDTKSGVAQQAMSINIDHIMYVTNVKSSVIIALSDSSEITLPIFDKYSNKETKKGAASLKSSIDNALRSTSGNKVKKVELSSEYFIKTESLGPVKVGEVPVSKA